MPPRRLDFYGLCLIILGLLAHVAMVSSVPTPSVAIAGGSVTEDQKLQVVVTPWMLGDSDLSETMHKIRFLSTAALKLDYHSIASTVSELGSVLYTLSRSGSGFARDAKISGLSVSHSHQCDKDFTFSVSSFSSGADDPHLESTTASTAVLIQAAADEPVVTVQSPQSKQEDERIPVLFTPTATDTDWSDLMRLFRVQFSGAPPLRVTFGSAAGMKSIMNGLTYTLSVDGGWGSGYPSSGLFMTPAVQCDIDFTAAVSAISVEVNGRDIVASLPINLEVSLAASVDVPTVLSETTLDTTEDRDFSLRVTPGLLDTDHSEGLLLLVSLYDGPGEFRRLTLSGLPGTTSSLAGTVYTLTVAGSGLAAATVVADYSVTPAVDCDVDFVLSVKVRAIEGNGGSDAFSSVFTVSPLVRGVVDGSTLTVVPSGNDGTEDTFFSMQLTPLASDSDYSERLLSLSLASGPVSKMSFSAVATTSSEVGSGVYTLTKATVVGFNSNGQILLTATPAIHCDVDFTLAARVQTLEVNGGSRHAGTAVTVGVGLSAWLDLGYLPGQSATSVKEDVRVKYVLSPNLVDTDGSEAVWRIHSGAIVPNNVALYSFSGIAGTSSEVNGGVYKLTAGGTGFALDTVIPGVSMSGPVQCDVDFTITMAAKSTEQNSLEDNYMAPLTVGTVLSAVADEPSLGVASPLSVQEDQVVELAVTPSIGADTDLSEHIRKVGVSGFGSSLLGFASVSSTSSVFSLGTSRYTLTSGDGTGYASGAEVAMTATGPSQCDIDFTVTATVYSVEANRFSTTASSTKSVGIEIIAVADAPGAVLQSQSGTEDSAISFLFTPTSVDSDRSELLPKMNVRIHGGTPFRITFSSGPTAVSIVAGGAYTLTVNFSPGYGVTFFQVTPSVESDIDFTLSTAFVAVEPNGMDSVYGSVATVGMAVTASPDEPSLQAAAIIGTTEDVAVAMQLTPSLRDTDGSEVLALLVATYSGPGAFGKVSFNGVSGTSSTVAGNVYTLAISGTGLTHAALVEGYSMSPAVHSDADFTLTLKTTAMESNGATSVVSASVSVGAVILADSDGPSVSIQSPLSTNEDNAVPVLFTPTSADTDRSDVMRLVRFQFSAAPVRVTFGASPGTSSSINGDTYTLSVDGGWGSGYPSTGFHITPATECDVDFTVTVSVISEEVNGLDIGAGPGSTLGVEVTGVADEPSVQASAVVSGTEDVAAALPVTPGLIDTDWSESLTLLVASYAGPGDFTRVTFFGLPGTTSSAAGTVYTLTVSVTGLASSTAIAGYSVSPAVESDVDFTLSMSTQVLESNTLTFEYSSTISIAVGMNAEPDIPSLSVTPLSLSINEDMSFGFLLTPHVGLDSDLSELLSSLSISMISPLVQKTSFSLLPSTTSVMYDTGYTFAPSGSGFQSNEIDVSMSPPSSCDVDFSLTWAVASTEANGGVTVLSVPSILAVSVLSDADSAQVDVGEIQASEDVSARLSITPLGSTDTDLSDVLSRVLTTGNDFHGMSFSGISFCVSSMSVGFYTLSALSVSGFTPNVAILGMSVSTAAECDSDFTLSFSVSSLERNGFSREVSPENSIGIVVHANPDSPSHESAAISTSVFEDMSTVLHLTPSSGSDTDMSESLSTLLVSALEPAGSSLYHFSFSSVPGTTSVVDAGGYTATGLPSFTSGAGLLLSVSPVGHCDVDFTLLSQFSSMEANSGAVAWSPAHALGVAVSAVPETPDIDVFEPLHATEDYPYPLALTPLGGSDTDGSDTLSRLAMSSAGALLSHFWFAPLAGCASSLTGEAFTLSGPISGFASGGRLAGLSVMSAPECSVDFTLSVTAMQVEANGMEERASGSKSLGVELRGVVDLPQLSAMAATSTKEDEAAALVVTPVSGGDTDLSDVMRAIAMTGTPLDLRRLRFAGVAGTVSSTDQDRYTVTSVSVSGFADSQLLPAFSVSPADACDRDFTLYASVAAVEANELATGSSTTRSIGVLLESVTDAPVFAVAAALGAVEDTWTSIGAVLAHSDTDGSEPLRSLFATGVSTGASFSAVNGAISFLEAAVYTLSAVSGSGFGMGEFLALSLLGPVQCDIDFTVTTALVSLEGNTMVSAIGGVRTSGLAILAVCDEPFVDVPTTTSLLEDVGGLLQVTPRLSDSDGSETLQKFMVRDFVPNASSVAKCSFSAVASTTSGVTQKGYTLTAAASGFRPGVLVPELTMTAPSSCDVDFSFSVHARSAESNGGCLVDSPVATVGVSLSCVVGVPILGISDSALTTAEDHRAPVSVTPALEPDTDGSELLVLLYGHTYSSGTYVPAPGSVMVSGADADFAAGGVFTLSAAGQGFASGQPLQLSAVLAPACDRDFTLSVAAASLESNNRDQSASTLRTCGLSVTAVADEPGMAAASVVTATEDATVGITVTPSLSSDTDYSQMLRKVVYAGFVPGGDAAVASKVTFSGLVVSVSSTSSNAYTVTAAGLGFSGGFALYEAKVLAAAECDVDFSFSARVASVEVNGKDLSYSSDATVGIKVYAVGDEPAIATGSPVLGTEDFSLAFVLSPTISSDTDSSESFAKIMVSSTSSLSTCTFSSVLSTLSTVESSSYTLSFESIFVSVTALLSSTSVSPPVHCDIDFTLSVSVAAVEANELDETRSSLVSSGIALNATADTVLLSVEDRLWTEDFAIHLPLTPAGSADTDLSDITSVLSVFGRHPTPLDNGMGMLALETAPEVTVATAPNLFTLEMSGTGFAQGTVVAVSMSAEAECDTDFTLSVAVVGMERNGWDRIPSSSSSLSVGWAGLADVPLLDAAASTLTLEDHGTALLLTPYASGDTDSSELLAQIGSSVVAPVTFASISDTTSSHTSSLYTLQATDSDFQPGVSIAGMSAQASPQTDVDFTLTWFSSVAEANGFDEESSEGVLLGIALVAVADAPDVLTLPSIASTEDVQSHLPVTPWASADSDFSEALLKLRLTATDAAVMAGTTFTADFAAAISESTAGCTITAGGTGFASGVGLLGFSVSHAPQCDLDFALTSVVFVVEHNGRDAAVSTESATALAVVASADQPGISVSPATVTSEDVHVAIGLTPALGADTDGSEALWRLAVGRGGSVPLAAYSFSSVNDTSSAVDPSGMQYTLTVGGSGFGSGARIVEMSVSGAVQCDVDFVLRVDVCLTELNGADEAFTAGGAAIGISVGAACDEPFIRVFSSTSTTEEVSVPLRVTPGLDADTDESEIIRSVLGIGVPVGITLSGVFSTASDAAAQAYTLSDLSEDGFPDTEILPDFGVVGAAQCDVDFRLAFRASSLEGNGGDAAASTVASVAVVVRAAADSPALLVDPSRGTTEDVRTALQITPLAGIDSDGSQALVAVSVAPLGSNFVFSLPANVSLAEQGSGYLLEGSFEVSGELSSFSVTSAAQCDSDFVLSFAVLAEERNGFDSAWSTSLSIGIEVAAVVDSPLLNVTAEHDTLRTDDTYVVTSLCGFADTDGSEALERMEVGGLTKDAVLTVGSEEVTAGIVPIEIDLLSDGIGGAITDDTVNVVLSISAPVFCDSDFSLTLSVAVVEENGGDALWSEAVLFPVDVAVVYDPCEYQLHDCDESATCQYVDDASYACACNSGYEGSGESCEDVNECTAGGHNCAGDADCSNADGSFFCVCKSQFYGDGVTCTACGGNATSPLGSLVASDCTCNSGYSGTAWDLCVDEDECAAGSHTCVENAVCLNSLGSFSCSCASGYEGTPTKSCTDIDECDDNQACDAHALCSNSAGSYSCTCNEGYSGNGLTCTTCGDNAFESSEFPFECECNSGYAGDPESSCKDVNECTLGLHNCDAEASCTNTKGSFTCKCFANFWGTGVDGSCTACAANATSYAGSQTSDGCSCKEGFEGDGFTYCQDVDECSAEEHDCVPGAVCGNTAPGYDCYCPANYYGDGSVSCSPCAEHAHSAVGSLFGTSCACNVGFEGEPASSCTDVDECDESLHSCNLDQVCWNNFGSFTCVCPMNYWGDAESCSPCAENAVSPEGSTLPEDCSCIDGYLGDGHSSCELAESVYIVTNVSVAAPASVDLSEYVDVSVSYSITCAANSCIEPPYTIEWAVEQGQASPELDAIVAGANAASSFAITVPPGTLYHNDLVTFLVRLCALPVDAVVEVKHTYCVNDTSSIMTLGPCLVATAQSNAKEDSVTRRNHIQIDGTVDNSACSNATQPVFFDWAETASTDDLGLGLTTLEKSPKLSIAPYTLLEGVPYMFTLEACIGIRECVSVSTPISVIPSELVVFVEGGNRQTGAHANLVLDASPSHDPDAAVEYTSWECYVSSRTDNSDTLALADVEVFSQQCFVNEMEADASGKVNTILAQDVVPGLYYFQFTLWTAVKDPEVHAILVEVLDSNIHETTIIGPIGQQNVNQQLVLTAYANGGVPTSVVWTLVSGQDLDLSSTAVVRTSRTSRILKLAEGVLDPSQSYRFRATTTSSSGESYAEFLVYTNAGPTVGTFSVSPGNGTAMETAFTLTVHDDWEDEEDDLPFSYKFVQVLASGKVKALSEYSPRSSLTTTLSASTEIGQTVQVRAYVRDQWGAASFSDVVQVVVVWPAVADDEVATYAGSVMDGEVATALARGDTEGAVNTVTTLGEFVNLYDTDTASVREDMLGVVVDVSVGDASMSEESAGMYIEAATTLSTKPHTLSAAAVDLAYGVYRDIAALAADYSSGTTLASESVTESLEGLSSLLAVASDDPEQQADTADTLTETLGNLARAQLNGAVPGETPACAQAGSLLVGSQRVDQTVLEAGHRVYFECVEDGPALTMDPTLLTDLSLNSTQPLDVALVSYDDDPYGSPATSNSAMLVSAVLAVSAHDATSGDELPVLQLTDPLEITIPIVSTANSDGLTSQVLFRKTPDPEWLSEECVTLPNPYPRSLLVQWKDNVTNLVVSEMWEISNLPEGCVETVDHGFVDDKGDPLRIFEKRTMESECWFIDSENADGCYWDNYYQAFLGTECVLDPNMRTLCTHLTDFSGYLVVPDIHVISISDFAALRSTDEVIVPLVVMAGGLGLMILLGVLMTWNFERQRARVLRRLFHPDLGHKVCDGVDLWAFELSTSDDEPAMGPGRRLAEFIGIPLPRLLMALPSAAQQMRPWEHSEQKWADESDVIGTILVLAYIDAFDLAARPRVRSLIEAADLYFAGSVSVYPMNSRGCFVQLVEKAKIMLHSNLARVQWRQRAHVWKLTYLQHTDGHWELTPALCEVVSPTFRSYHLCDVSEDSFERVVATMPSMIREFEFEKGSGTSPEIVWATMLATVFLERQKEFYIIRHKPLELTTFGLGQIYLENVVPTDLLADWRREASNQLEKWESVVIADLREAREKHKSRFSVFTRRMWEIRHWFERHHQYIRVWALNAVGELTTKPGMMLALFCVWAGLILTNVWFFYSRSLKCCENLKDAMCEDSNIDTPCYDDEYFEETPSCGTILDEYSEMFPRCEEFPNGSAHHRLWVTLISAAVVIPIEKLLMFILKKCMSWHVRKNHWVRLNVRTRIKRFVKKAVLWCKGIVHPSDITLYVGRDDDLSTEAEVTESRWLSARKLAMFCYCLYVCAYTAMAFFTILYATLLYENIESGAENQVFYAILQAFSINFFLGEITEGARQAVLRVLVMTFEAFDSPILSWGETLTDGFMFSQMEDVMMSEGSHMVDYFAKPN